MYQLGCVSRKQVTFICNLVSCACMLSPSWLKVSPILFDTMPCTSLHVSIQRCVIVNLTTWGADRGADLGLISMQML